MYVTPNRLDLLQTVNRISCCKSKWYVRRFDPDKAQNSHLFIYWASFNIFCGLGLRFFWIHVYLTIILRNRAEYRLILSRRGRRPSRLKSDDIPQD